MYLSSNDTTFFISLYLFNIFISVFPSNNVSFKISLHIFIYNRPYIYLFIIIKMFPLPSYSFRFYRCIDVFPSIGMFPLKIYSTFRYPATYFSLNSFRKHFPPVDVVARPLQTSPVSFLIAGSQCWAAGVRLFMQLKLFPRAELRKIHGETHPPGDTFSSLPQNVPTTAAAAAIIRPKLHN